jgi:hypothetical protein
VPFLRAAAPIDPAVHVEEEHDERTQLRDLYRTHRGRGGGGCNAGVLDRLVVSRVSYCSWQPLALPLFDLLMETVFRTSLANGRQRNALTAHSLCLGFMPACNQVIGST